MTKSKTAACTAQWQRVCRWKGTEEEVAGWQAMD
jgi:hypothetical protein